MSDAKFSSVSTADTGLQCQSEFPNSYKQVAKSLICHGLVHNMIGRVSHSCSMCTVNKHSQVLSSCSAVSPKTLTKKLSNRQFKQNMSASDEKNKATDN